jgi:hypothetical protein
MEVAGYKAIPAKNEPKCKFCVHPERERIDYLLLCRSKRQIDPASGQQMNGEYVRSALAALGVQNPTEDNMKNHFRKHVEVVKASLATDLERVESELYQELIDAAPAHLTATNVAEWQLKLWMARELARLRSGEGPSVTTDQAQNAQRILVQARSDEAQRTILGGLAGALGAAFKTLPEGERKSLPSPEVIEDAEVEEVG